MNDEFTYRHVHRGSPQLLFECMTAPEHLTHFWGPVGTTTPVDGIVVDLRVGGAFETQMISEQTGAEFIMRAVYEAVDPPHRLVWREVASTVTTTITFTDLGDGTTEVLTRQQNLPESHRSPEARAGWATALDRFADYVTGIG